MKKMFTILSLGLFLTSVAHWACAAGTDKQEFRTATNAGTATEAGPGKSIPDARSSALRRSNICRKGKQYRCRDDVQHMCVWKPTSEKC